MKLFKSKNEKMKELFEEKVNSMNFDSPNEFADKIDEKLSILFKNMNYDEYVEFVKTTEYLNTYDDIMSKFANNVPLSKNMIDVLPTDFYDKVDHIVQNKIDELNL